jgi:transcriptional regulator with XRE-family HTH domain
MAANKSKPKGRPKGAVNKLSATAKENIAAVFTRLGGTAAMAYWAKEHPTEFYKLYARLTACGSRGHRRRLVDRAGLHRNFIGLIERGQRNPTYLTLLAISNKLDVPLSKLIFAAEQRRQ